MGRHDTSADRLMANDEIDWVALDRYVAGEGSPDERDTMRRRLAASPELAAIVQDGSVSSVIPDRGTLGVNDSDGAAQVTRVTIDGYLAGHKGI